MTRLGNLHRPDREALNRLVDADDRSVAELRAVVLRAAATMAASGIGDDDDVACVVAPGRIELFGKHTDYAGGRSLVCAIPRYVVVLAVRSDRNSITDVSSGITTELPVSTEATDDVGVDRYASVVLKRLTADFGESGGIATVVSSNLPVAAGMSSSSALVTALVAGHLTLSGCESVRSPDMFGSVERFADYCAAVENGRPSLATAPAHHGSVVQGVGTEGGSQDHAASLCGKARSLIQVSFRPTSVEATIAFPDDLSLYVAVSGVTAYKAGAAMDAYNRVSRAFTTIERIVVAKTGCESARAALDGGSVGADLQSLIPNDVDGFDRAYLVGRWHQFVQETTRIVPGVAAAFRSRDYETLGELARDSQRMAEECLGNQVPETSWLAEAAYSAGANASSAFGAGFGGAVWAIGPTATADEFVGGWRAAYLDRFPNRAASSSFFPATPSGGAFMSTADGWLDLATALRGSSE